MKHTRLFFLLFALGCGPTGPTLPCMRDCAARYDCGPGEPNPACENARDDCMTDCQGDAADP